MINYSVSGSCKFKMNHPKVFVVLYTSFQAIVFLSRKNNYTCKKTYYLKNTINNRNSYKKR